MKIWHHCFQPGFRSRKTKGNLRSLLCVFRVLLQLAYACWKVRVYLCVYRLGIWLDGRREGFDYYRGEGTITPTYGCKHLITMSCHRLDGKLRWRHGGRGAIHKCGRCCNTSQFGLRDELGIGNSCPNMNLLSKVRTKWKINFEKLKGSKCRCNSLNSYAVRETWKRILKTTIPIYQVRYKHCKIPLLSLISRNHQR